MPNVTMPSTNTLVNAGFLLWAPLGTALPANTVVGSVFTDAWPAAWIPLGRTAAGTKIEDTGTTADLESAEDFYALDTLTTKRAATVSFNLLNFTAGNLQKALNGAVSTVTGSTTTLLTQISAPNPVNEVSSMIGWEALDGTVRWVGYKLRNSGNLSIQMAKAPNMAQIPWTATLAKPATTQPYDWFFAGAARA